MSKVKKILSSKIPFEIKDLWDDTEFLTYSLIIVMAIVLIGGGLVLQKIYGRNPPEIAQLSFGALLNLTFILGGLIGVLRREIPRPGLPSIKGFWAVFQSAIVLIVSGLVELLLFYLIVTRVLD